MASFGGHTLPGTFFIIFGLYYVFKYSRQYLRYRSRKSYYTDFNCCGKIPCSDIVIEGCFKVFFTSVGILVELFYPGAPMGRLHDEHGDFTHPMNWQHTTMYFFFGLSGVFDMICYSGRKIIPIGVDRLFGGLALFVEGYLFYFHLHGRSLIDTRVHILLVLGVWPSALIAFAEVFAARKQDVLHVLEMLRSTLLIFQGFWFWQAAYILYPPNGKKWDPCFTEMKMAPHGDSHTHEDEEVQCDKELEHLNLNFITLFWTWHLGLCIMIVTVIYTVVYKFVKFRGNLDRSFSNGYIPVMDGKHQNGRLLMDNAEDGL